MSKQTPEQEQVMPILNEKNQDIKSVPFSFLDREKAMSVHSQTLERLAERGGMGIMEILHNRNMIEWNELNPPTKIHVALLKFMLAFDTRGKIINNERLENDALTAEVDRLKAERAASEKNWQVLFDKVAKERDVSESLNTELVEVLKIITADKLRALAEWLDIHDRANGFIGMEVQDQLRKMATLSEAALSRAGRQE